MDLQKRIKQCDRCSMRIVHRIQRGDITVAGLKAALFNLNRHIVHLENAIAEKGVAKTVSSAKEIIKSSNIQDIITGKKPIKQKVKNKAPLSKKKIYNNPQADFLVWRGPRFFER